MILPLTPKGHTAGPVQKENPAETVLLKPPPGASHITTPVQPASQSPAHRPRVRTIPGDDIIVGSSDYVSNATAAFEEALLLRSTTDDLKSEREKVSRNNVLVKALFQLKLSNESAVKKQLLSRDLPSLKRELVTVCHRYGLRQLTPDDFHTVLGDVLCDETLPFSETRLLFELFDSNRSGLVDLDEFIEGIKLLQVDDRTMILMYCKKIFTEGRNFKDTVLSASEIRTLLETTVEYFGNDETLSSEAAAVMDLVWSNAHQGQVLVPSLREFVHLKGKKLKDAFFAIKPYEQWKGKRQVRSPEPTGVFEMLKDSAEGNITSAQGSSGTQHKTAVKKPMAASRPQGDSRGALLTSEQGPHRQGESDLLGISKSPLGGGRLSARRQTQLTRLKSPLTRGSAAPPGGSFAMSSSAENEVLDVYHPRFRGDIYRNPDLERQMNAPEPGNPQWYISRDQLWKKEEGAGPVPIIDV